jgi:hypothetical protein
MFKVENGELFFSSGKVVKAYAGVIGLSPDCERAYGGYDQDIHEENDELTSDEKIELADYMIGQWQKFKDNA